MIAQSKSTVAAITAPDVLASPLSAAAGENTVTGGPESVASVYRDDGSELDPEELSAQVERALEVIEEMPPEVAQRGDLAVSEYMRSHSGTGVASGSVAGEFGTTAAFWGKAWHITKCVSAITVAIGGVVVPAAQVLKIKKLISAVGGTRALASKIVDVARKDGSFDSRIKEVFGALRKGTVSLPAEVLGIDAIRKECF